MSKARLVITALFVKGQSPAEIAGRYGVHRSPRGETKTLDVHLSSLGRHLAELDRTPEDGQGDTTRLWTTGKRLIWSTGNIGS